jgi:hypothetical protein
MARTLFTDAQVANLALLRVGQRETIDSLTEPTAQAQAVNPVYAATRDSLLEQYPWRFATRRQVLSTTSLTRLGWTYVYALPTDCLTPLYLNQGTHPTLPGGRIPFEVELDDKATSQVLVTDWGGTGVTVELVYVAQLPVPALWPATFAQAVAWQLAVELCLSLPVKPQLAANAQQMAIQSLHQAMAHDARFGQEDNESDGESVRIRE